MTRELSTGCSPPSAPVVRPFMAAHLDYPDGAVRVRSLPTSVTIGGQTYYGTGVWGEISAIEAGAEARSYGFTLALSGIPATGPPTCAVRTCKAAPSPSPWACVTKATA